MTTASKPKDNKSPTLHVLFVCAILVLLVVGIRYGVRHVWPTARDYVVNAGNWFGERIDGFSTPPERPVGAEPVAPPPPKPIVGGGALRITSFDVSPNPNRDGNTFKMTIRVENQSDKPAGPFSVVVEDMSHPIGPVALQAASRDGLEPWGFRLIDLKVLTHGFTGKRRLVARFHEIDPREAPPPEFPPATAQLTVIPYADP